MSETRVAWKPWRAKTRIAASRICRRLSTGTGTSFVRARLVIDLSSRTSRSRSDPSRRLPDVIYLRAAIRQRGQLLAEPLLGGQVELGADHALAVAGKRQQLPACVDDRRVPVGGVMRRRLADLVRREDECLVLDRPGPQQDLPVGAPGGQGEGRGDREQQRAARGEAAEELGEAQVVTDGQPD